MDNILIYKAEAKAGLVETIRSNCSIAYCVPAIMLEEQQVQVKLAASLGIVSLGEDLFPVQSVLATTNWNKNDDVFIKDEVWKSRHTARRKPTNIEHNEDQIIGHILDTWVVNNDGNIVPDDTTLSNVPDTFHICTASVIYKSWEKVENQERADKLIAEILEGNKFVSMECLFTGFDYALVDPNEQFFVVARSEDTAFLTKHLRVYGGTGEFKNHRIGRILKNITFSGKGFVDKPANPNSIIFNDKPEFTFSNTSYNVTIEDSGVYFNKQPSAAQIFNNEENANMADNNDLLKEQLQETKAALAEITKQKKVVEAQLAEADTAKYESQIKELQDTIQSTEEKIKDTGTALTESKATIDELTKEIDELTKANDKLVEEISQVEAEKTTAFRVTTLVDGGISKEVAQGKVEKFTNLNDEQFAILAQDLIDAAKAQSQTVEDDKRNASESSDETDEEQENAEANDETLETAEADEQVDGTVDTTDDVEDTRVAIASLLAADYLNVKMDSEEESS